MDIKDKSNDILADKAELKKMPFRTPEGYFEQFSVKGHNTKGISSKGSRSKRVIPYITAAAMFTVIAAAGTAIMKNVLNNDSTTDYIVWTYDEIIPYTDPESLYYSYNSEKSLSEEDIIEYLIFNDTDLTMFTNE